MEVSLRMKLPQAVLPSKMERSHSLFGAAFYTLTAPQALSTTSNESTPKLATAHVGVGSIGPLDPARNFNESKIGETIEQVEATTKHWTWSKFINKPWNQVCIVCSYFIASTH